MLGNEPWERPLRSVTLESPVNPPTALALTTLRNKAKSQLSGTVETLNAVITHLVTSLDAASGTWLEEQASSNPADLFRHVLQSPANKKAGCR